MADIIKSEKKALRVLTADSMSLKDQSYVDVFVGEWAEITAAKKEVTADDTEYKDNLKRMAAPYMSNGETVTCYSWESGKKAVVSCVGGGYSIDEKKLLESLYEQFGEEYGDKTGKAWRAFISISDEVPVPRIINQNKLADVMSRKGGKGEICAAVDAAKTVNQPTIKAQLSNITKAEKSMHDKDGYCPTMIAEVK